MFGLFFGAIVNHWLFSFGGVALLIYAIIEKIRQKDVEAWVFWGGALLCLFVACYGAWVDEHHNADAVIAEKARAFSDLGECSSNLRSSVGQNTILQSQVTSQQGTINNQQSNFTAMQRGVNSQQSTVNSCVVALAKINTPEPQRFHMEFAPVVNHAPTEGKHFKLLVLTTNKSVASVNMIVGCTGDVKSMEPIIPGLGIITLNVQRSNQNNYLIKIIAAPIDTDHPVIVWIGYDSDNLGNCTLSQQT